MCDTFQNCHVRHVLLQHKIFSREKYEIKSGEEIKKIHPRGFEELRKSKVEITTTKGMMMTLWQLKYTLHNGRKRG